MEALYWIIGFFMLAFVVFIFTFMRAVGKQNAFDKALEGAFLNAKVYKYQTPFDDKLVELGVKEKFDNNLQIRLNRVAGKYEELVLRDILESTTFSKLVYRSFNWSKTPEGHEFWLEISKK